MSHSARQQEYLKLLGIDVWVSRDAAQVTVPARPEQSGTGPSIEGGWPALRAEVRDCRKCPLHMDRTQTVFGVGNETADWMIIGEAPGAEEDRQGEPFVGRAGKLLNAMLLAIGLKREQVFIANILKCRPPQNRDPQPHEAAACEDYLQWQIALVKPRIILAVGRIAAQNLLKVDTQIGKMRGQTYEYGASRIPVVVTYHPAYLLRTPREKRKAWEDLQRAMQVYKGTGQ